MKRPKQPPLALIARAAYRRALATPWDAIARDLGVSAEECKSWRHRYPEAWDYLYRFAMDRTLEELAEEARGVLRELAESAKSAAVRRDAARALKQHDKAAGPRRHADLRPAGEGEQPPASDP